MNRLTKSRLLSKAILLVITCLNTSVFAAQIPQGTHDARIQSVNYNPGEVVEIKARTGLATRIVFAPDETILEAASGFTQGWEILDRQNVLYIKPKSIKPDLGQVGTTQAPTQPTPGTWDTNLMVRTTARLYDFDLRLQPNDKPVAYRIEFHYPGENHAKTKYALDRQLIDKKLNTSPTPCNWQYTMQIGKRSKSIAPTMAFDDARFTYLKFPNNRDFPAVFLVGEDKKESLVNSHIENDMLVVHRVAPNLVLRLGKEVVGIYNEHFDLDGLPAKGGTTVPGVERVVRPEEKQTHA